MAVRPVGGSWPVRACSDVAIVAAANLEGEAEKPQPPDATALREAVRLRMSPPNRESVTEIGRDTRITTGRHTEHRSVLAPWLLSCPVPGFHRYSRVHSGVMPMPKDVTSNSCQSVKLMQSARIATHQTFRLRVGRAGRTTDEVRTNGRRFPSMNSADAAHQRRHPAPAGGFVATATLERPRELAKSMP